MGKWSQSSAQQKGRRVWRSIEGKGTVRSQYRLMFLLGVCSYVLSGLEAYSIFGIPISWFAVLIPILAYVLNPERLLNLPKKTWPVWFYIGSMSLVTVFAHIRYGIPAPLESMTTSYLGYVSLRYINILGAVALMHIVHDLYNNKRREQFIGIVMLWGGIVSAYALYVYYAQQHGLWEIPRSRIGTGGGSQSVEFSYAFHRAMGSFREPSHLAEWLVLPLLLATQHKGILGKAMASLIGGVIFLTGSLSVFIALIGGIIITGTMGAVRQRRIGAVLTFSGLVVSWMVLFLLFVSGERNIFYVIYERMLPIMDDGMLGTNRAYIYDYVLNTGIPVWGQGIGRAQISFAEDQGSNIIVSFLNLYLNTLFCGGIATLIIVIILLVLPVLHYVRQWPNLSIHGALIAYISWMIIYFGRVEELSLSFAVVWGMVLAMPERRSGRCKQAGWRSIDNNMNEEVAGVALKQRCVG